VNIRETIEVLSGIADVLPDGLDTEVVVHLCIGPDCPVVVTREFVLEIEHTIDVLDGQQRSATAVIAVHPHRAPVHVRDPQGLDGELAQLLDPDK
jgi:hypothetical protein